MKESVRVGRVGERRAVAVAAAMVACSFNAWGDAVIQSGGVTVNLDSLPGTGTGNAITVPSGVTVSVSGGQALYGQNKTFQVFNLGFLASSDPNNFTVHLQNGNQVTNSGVIEGNGGGVTMVNSSGSLTNTGSIIATTGPGVMFRAGGTVNNDVGGTITGGTYGIYLLNASESATNSGTITATNGAGVRLEGGNTSFVNNAGAHVGGTSYGVQFVNGAESMTNSGTVTASTGVGVDFGAGGTLVNNAGASISGGTIGVHTRNGSADITTAGTISGSTYSVQFETGNGKLTMQTGALLNGPAYGGNTSRVVFQGEGTAKNDFLSFGALDMTGNRWTLLGRTEAKASTVSNGLLAIGEPGSPGARLVADTITVNPGAALAAYDSVLSGNFTNNGAVFIGAGLAYPGATQPSTVLLNGSMTNSQVIALSGGAPWGNTFRVSGNYVGTGVSTLFLGTLLDDDFLGPLNKQVTDRLLVGGNASGHTFVNVVTRIDSLQAIQAAIAAAANRTQVSTTRVLLDGQQVGQDVVLPDTGVSIIQVAGTATAQTFTLEHGYVTGGTRTSTACTRSGPARPTVRHRSLRTWSATPTATGTTD